MLAQGVGNYLKFYIFCLNLIQASLRIVVLPIINNGAYLSGILYNETFSDSEI